MTTPVLDDVRDFWMGVALGLKDEMVIRGNRIEELEQQLREQSLAATSIQGLAYNALRTDGAHHKQFYLEQILRLVTESLEYETMRADAGWKAGIAP